MKKKTTKKKSVKSPKSNPKTVGFFCNLPPGVRNEIVRRAKKQDVSQGKIVVDAIKATKVSADMVKPETPSPVKLTTKNPFKAGVDTQANSKELKRERDRRYRAKKKAGAVSDGNPE